MKTPKGTEALASKKELGEYGTATSGFAEGGPFSCLNCVHMKHTEEEDVCTHPSVMADPDLADKKTEEGYITVDWDDCCRFVRPLGITK